MPSRADIFRDTPSEALPAPLELRIAFFMSAAEHDTARVVDDGIVLNDAFYEPVRTDEDARDCMSKAASLYKLYKIKMPILRAKIKERELLFVKFPGRDFEPIRKAKARNFRGKRHPEEQKEDIQRISSRAPGYRERMEQLILDTFGGELGQDAYFKTAVPLNPPQAASSPNEQSESKIGKPGNAAAPDGGTNNNDKPNVPAMDASEAATEETDKLESVPSQQPPTETEKQPEQPKPSKTPDAVRRLRERFLEDEEAL